MIDPKLPHNAKIDKLYNFFSDKQIKSIKAVYLPFGRKFKIEGKNQKLTTIVNYLYNSAMELKSENTNSVSQEEISKIQEISKNLLKLDKPDTKNLKLLEKLRLIIINIFPFKNRRKLKLDQINTIVSELNNKINPKPNQESIVKEKCLDNQFLTIRQDTFSQVAKYLNPKELSLFAKTSRANRKLAVDYQKNNKEATFHNLTDEGLKQLVESSPKINKFESLRMSSVDK